MADFLRERGIEGATVLEIGGGVGEIEIELIFSEKALPHGVLLSRVVGVSLVAIGIAGVIAPDTVSAIT
jgi:hypothetical protein